MHGLCNWLICASLGFIFPSCLHRVLHTFLLICSKFALGCARMLRHVVSGKVIIMVIEKGSNTWRSSNILAGAGFIDTTAYKTYRREAYQWDSILLVQENVHKYCQVTLQCNINLSRTLLKSLNSCRRSLALVYYSNYEKI